ncbi:hypothetical protein [Hyalangium versicolor]|uniref:hypothetical protein n=1 Tax=Hyalangium versicolor TaxID=2861190 RepID=UPI001CCF20B6|nr:hypothetical protein [Hyalangium versicolor]
MAERGGVREKVLRVVIVGGTMLGALGGGATGMVALNHGEEQRAVQTAHTELMQKLERAAERDRDNAERLARIESDVSWLVRMVGAPTTDQSGTPSRVGKR